MSDAFVTQCIKAGVPSVLVIASQEMIHECGVLQQRLDNWDPLRPSDRVSLLIDSINEVTNCGNKIAAILTDRGLPLTIGGAK